MSTIALSKRRLAKNAVSQVVAFGLSGATKAVVAVVAARWLGPQGFGVFTLAWTVASMASFFAPLGLDYRLIRELNRSSGSEDVDLSLPPAVLSSVLLAALVVVVPRVTGAGPELTGALTAGAVFVVLSAPVLILRATFHAREKMELETAGLALEGLVSLAAVGFVLINGGGVAATMLALSAGRGANVILSVVFYRRLFGPLHLTMVPSRWPALLKVSVPMGFAYIFHTLMLRFDVVMLGFFRSPEDVGLYSAATIIVMTVPIISTAFNTSLYPVLSRAKDPQDPELKKVFDATFNMLLVMGLACAAGLTVLAHPIIDLFYGSDFQASIGVLIALSWILPFRFVNNLAGVALNATDQAGRRTLAVGASAFVNIGINLLFIPLWGYQGAVVSTLLTELVLTMVLRRAVRPLAPPFLRPLVEGGALAGLLAVTVAFTPGHVFVRAGIGSVLFAAAFTFVLWARGIAATVGKEVRA